MAFGQSEETFLHDGIEREYIYYAPDDIPVGAPLIFVLHGYTSVNNIIAGYSGFNSIADEHKVAICYPLGTRDVIGNTHWNANLEISETDDVGFLTELAIFLQEDRSLSSENTFACGMSNGGFMSYTLACEAPAVFSAVASVTGTMSGTDWEDCSSSDPIPVMQITGLMDDVVPADGSMSTFGGWGGAPDYLTVNEFWKEKNECASTEVVDLFPTVQATYHRDGINGNQVWLFAISNMEHNWPGFWSTDDFGIIAAEEIWDFFSLNTEMTTDVLNLPQIEFNVFPNPAQDFVNISMENSVEVPLRLYSSDGKWLKELELSELTANVSGFDQWQLDISDLQSGIYFIALGKQSTKFLKL